MDIALIQTIEKNHSYFMCAIHFKWETYHESSAENLDILLTTNLQNSVKKRKATYLAGRYCAKQALLQAGYAESPILIPTAASHPGPVWPENWVGSITHTDDLACSAVGKVSEFRGIGIDVEKIKNKELSYAELWTQVIHKSEDVILKKIPEMPKEKLFYLFFSMKESIYKCFFPLTSYFFDFHDIEIFSINLEKSTVKFKFNKYIDAEFNCDFVHEGAFQFFEDYIFTSVVLPLPSTTLI